MTTAIAQIMAAVGQTPEWSRAAAHGRPAPGLARAAAAAPADAALQLGAASWELSADEIAATAEPAWCGNSYRHDTFQARGLSYRNPERRSPQPGADAKQPLARVLALGRQFPNDPSIRAYQLRWLLRGPIWIPRAGVPTPADRPPPPPQLLEQFDAIARAGQRLEPANGFFDAMRAVASFAGERDNDGLRHLHSAAARRFWNDHVVDEARAVWKLLRTAYGDCGVEQLLRSEQEVGLAHLAVLRAVAQLAVQHAAVFDRSGDHARAQEVRGDVMRLGLLLQGQSPLVTGKEVGDALFYLGMAPATSKALAPHSPRSESDRRQRRERYATYLEAHDSPAAAAWVRAEGQRVDATHRRVRRALAGLGALSSYWPPRGLAVWWELDVILVQQFGVILALWGGVMLLPLWVGRKQPGTVPPVAIAWQWTIAHCVLLYAPLVTSIALEGRAAPFWPESIAAGLIMTGILGIARWVGALRQRQKRTCPSCDAKAHRRRTYALMALVSIVLPLGLLMPLLSWISYATEGGSILGLPWWGPPLGLDFPELAFLPAVLLCCMAFCWAAVVGLPAVAGLTRGVRLAAPYALGVLALLYVTGSVVASRASAEAARQMEYALSDPLAAMEATQSTSYQVRLPGQLRRIAAVARVERVWVGTGRPWASGSPPFQRICVVPLLAVRRWRRPSGQ